MKPVNDPTRAKLLFDLTIEQVKSFRCLGERHWTNPSGSSQKEQVYELESNGKKIWVSSTPWQHADKNEINRYGIICVIPDGRYNVLAQVLELNYPLCFSKRFNTRLFEEGNMAEVRLYGKFTVGRMSLSMDEFFNYLLSQGLESEIKIDEYGQKYFGVLTIINGRLEPQYVADRFVGITHLVHQFKDKYRR